MQTSAQLDAGSDAPAPGVVVSPGDIESNLDSRRAELTITSQGAPSAAAGTKRKRKRSSKSPTQRSLAYLRERGYIAEVVEKRLPRVFITKDLFGFIDIIAIKGEDIVGVQTTSGNNVADRMHKIIEHENYPIVIKAIRLVVHGWRKNAAHKWVLREVEL